MLDVSHLLVGAIVAVVLAGLALVVKWFETSKTSMETQKRVLQRIDDLTKQNFSLQEQVFKQQEQIFHEAGERGKQQEQITKLIAAETACRTREADLKADWVRQQHQITELQAKVGVTPKSEAVPGIIIGNSEGLIEEFSPSLTVFLGWTPEEMKGQSIEKLIPADMLDDYRRAFHQAVSPGGTVDVTKRIPTYALDKLGRRIPVMVSLRRWGGAAALITATITLRGVLAPTKTPTDDEIPIPKGVE